MSRVGALTRDSRAGVLNMARLATEQQPRVLYLLWGTILWGTITMLHAHHLRTRLLDMCSRDHGAGFETQWTCVLTPTLLAQSAADCAVLGGMTWLAVVYIRWLAQWLAQWLAKYIRINLRLYLVTFGAYLRSRAGGLWKAAWARLPCFALRIREKVRAGATWFMNSAITAITAIHALTAQQATSRSRESAMNTCSICMDKRADVGFAHADQTMHVACCGDCARNLTVCPICRKRIDGVYKVYTST